MNDSRTPIALFAYNRTDHTARVLGDLARCRRIDACSLHVFCDGAKDGADASRVGETRDVVRRVTDRWAGPKFIVQRDENVGLAASIIRGVTDLCDRFGRVIVIEDDLRLSPGFVEYMLRALDRFENEQEVYQVSGYMFPVDHPPMPTSFLLPLTTTWGWATWARAWRVLDVYPDDADNLHVDDELRHRFDLDGSYPYSRMLHDRLAGRNDSWGILWAWSVFRAGGLALHPRRSLTYNAGFDGSGTHCGAKRDSRSEQAVDVPELGFGESITFPERVEADMKAFARITAHLRATSGRKEVAACR